MNLAWMRTVLAGWERAHCRHRHLRGRVDRAWDCLHHDRDTGQTWTRDRRVGGRVDVECTRCGGYWEEAAV